MMPLDIETRSPRSRILDSPVCISMDESNTIVSAYTLYRHLR